jgi:hypothetical protein
LGVRIARGAHHKPRSSGLGCSSRPASAPRTTAAAARREEQARRARDRDRRSPPPHAGTSRPGPFCGACGGHRGRHTVHHDQAAHDRARRRYDGLPAKAASTGFSEEVAVCRAKAEQFRAKYGL